MSVPAENIERGVAAWFRQPLSDDDMLQAQALEQYIHDVNCVNSSEPRPSEVVFRTSYGDYDLRNHVYRWDLRDYREIFTNGFQAWPQNNTSDADYYNLLAHVNEGGNPLNNALRPIPRAFVSTTLNSGMRFTLNNPVGTLIYRYEIYAPGGIFVRETLGGLWNFPGQREIAFVGGIVRQYIRAAQIFRIVGYQNQYPIISRAEDVVVINAYFNPQSHPERLIQINRPSFYYFEQDDEGRMVQRLLRVRIYPANLEHHRERREAKATDEDPKEANEISYSTEYIPNPDESNDPAATLEFYTTDNPADVTDWYAKEVANLESYVNAAFRSSRTNEAYLFMKNEYVLVNYAPHSTDDKVLNGPLLICDGFPSLVDTTFGEYGIDSAFGTHHDGDVAFIFSGNLCAVMDYAPHSKDDKITKGPVTISAMFPCFKGSKFEHGIDAAFEATTPHEAYLFKGNKYALINYHSGQLLAEGPIVEGFPSLKGTIFERGIEAAFASHCRDEAYLFKGKSYALINFARDTNGFIVDNQVKEIAPNWPSLAAILPRKNKGVDVHDHEHIESAQKTDKVPEPHVHDEL